MPKAPIATVMKKMKISQKTTLAIPLLGDAPGRAASTCLRAELSLTF